tara:strand:- start:3591 stop:4940 length:1350 start_codon:yes stop_codon:yes gene_type:complete
MSLIFTILVFIITISIIVTFHEYGHYIAARLCGVKVLEFSVGFGKRLFGKRFGKDKTDYKVCALPLGGYVRMLDEREGEVKDSEKKRAFNNQNLSRRAIIVFSGPLFNFILAIFFYFLIFIGGYTGFQPSVSVLTSNSVAENIGMIEGDIIYSVNSNKVKTWSDATLQTIKSASNKKDIHLEVLRNGEIKLLSKVNYKKINFDNNNIFGTLGIYNFTSKSLKIGYIEKNSPAEKFGLMVGDKILSINNTKVNNWNEIVSFIKDNPSKNLKLYILRDSKKNYINVIPSTIIKDDSKEGRLGISPFIDEDEVLSNKIKIEYGFFESIKLSALKTYDFTILTLNFILKLIKGEASAKSISGPVGIAGYAADSFSSGYTSFLGLLAMLSISIGILNLLPIPMLDGGHLMYYLVEFIIRRPVPERVQLIFQQVGMTFLILLSIFALYNDLLRIM